MRRGTTGKNSAPLWMVHKGCGSGTASLARPGCGCMPRLTPWRSGGMRWISGFAAISIRTGIKDCLFLEQKVFNLNHLNANSCPHQVIHYK